MSYRITNSGLADYPPGASFGPRTLDDHEFVWLLSGTARWHVDGRTYALRAGSVALARPGMRDRFEWDRTQTTRHAYVHFSDTAGHRCEGGPDLRTLSPDDPLGSLLSYLIWLLAESSAIAATRADDVLALAVDMFTSGPLPTDTDSERPPPAVQAVADLLAARWADGVLHPVGLAELAAAASLSTVQLSRIFRSRYEHGPVGCVELLRLRAAEELLCRGNLPVARVATQCGFADARHLARRFTAIHGVSPSEARRRGPGAGRPSPLAAAGLLHLYREVRRELPAAPRTSTGRLDTRAVR